MPPAPSGDYELTVTAAEIEAIVDARYARFFPTLNLSPERLARFRALLIDRQQVTIDAANAAVTFGMNPVRELPAIQAAIESFQATIDEKLRDDFGASVVERFREYDRSFRERGLVDTLSAAAARAGDPLDPKTQGQLVRILVEQRMPMPANLTEVIYGGMNERAEVGAEAFARVSELLSARQIELLRALATLAPSDR